MAVIVAKPALKIIVHRVVSPMEQVALLAMFAIAKPARVFSV